MNQIVIITGGTKGIGFAAAKKFLSCSDKVIILGRHENEASLAKLKKEGEVTFLKADVSVAAVTPGWVKTGMIDKPIEEIGSRLHMKGRIILPEEIANAIWLMSLPKASAINGTTVMADDGYSSFKGVNGFQAE